MYVRVRSAQDLLFGDQTAWSTNNGVAKMSFRSPGIATLGVVLLFYTSLADATAPVVPTYSLPTVDGEFGQTAQGISAINPKTPFLPQYTPVFGGAASSASCCSAIINTCCTATTANTLGAPMLDPGAAIAAMPGGLGPTQIALANKYLSQGAGMSIFNPMVSPQYPTVTAGSNPFSVPLQMAGGPVTGVPGDGSYLISGQSSNKFTPIIPPKTAFLETDTSLQGFQPAPATAVCEQYGVHRMHLQPFPEL